MPPMKHFLVFYSVAQIADHFGVTKYNAAAFLRRKEIPAKYDWKTIEALKAMGLTVTMSQLADWHEAHREWRAEGCVGDAPRFPWAEDWEKMQSKSVAAE